MLPASDRRFTRLDVLAFLLCAVAVLLLFQTAPRANDFWWSDAPRHAMDGAFYHDVFRDLPVTHLRQYAMSYYVHYPALTALFYPPLFPVAEAAVFQVLGTSHRSAQFTVALFCLLAAWGGYRLCRHWLDRVASIAAVILFLSFPEVALWGRQVMLELPALAFLIWSCHLTLRYVEEESPWLLHAAWLSLLAGVYTKQTVIFIAPVLAGLVYLHHRRTGRSVRPLLVAAALMAAGLLPLAFVTWKFGQVNLNSVVGGHWTPDPIFSWSGLTFYAKRLPSQLGWPTLILAIAALITSVLRRRSLFEGQAFLMCWIVCGYCFFSLIALKEPRHTVPMLFPIAVLAMAGVREWLPRPVGPWVAAALAAIAFCFTLVKSQVPFVDGYNQAVDYVARNAPPNSVILFSGYRDGSFVFGMRTREDRRDLSVLRSDKLLLRVSQRRELGVEEKGLTDDQILQFMNQYGVSYIVSQPNFWDDLRSMQQFQALLRSPQFRRVASIPITSNVPHLDRELEIYQNLGAVSHAASPIRLELPIIGVAVEGNVGGGKINP